MSWRVLTSWFVKPNKSVREVVGQVQLLASTSADTQDALHQFRNSATSLSFSVSSVRDGCVALAKRLETM